MDRVRFVVLVAIGVSALLFTSAVVARYGGVWQPVSTPVEVARAPGLASSADFDGRTMVWIEAPAAFGDRARLAWRRQPGATTSYADLSTMGVEDADIPDLLWLDAGPRVSGDIVVFQVNGTVYVFDLSDRLLRDDFEVVGGGDENGVAISGTTVVWADRTLGTWDMWTFDVATGVMHAELTEETDDYAPALNDGWLVWYSRPREGAGACEVHAQPRSGGAVKELGPCAATGRGPALYGSRVAWYAPDDRAEGRLVVRLYDLDTRETGVLDRFDEPEGTPGGLDVSDRWIVRSAEGDEGGPAEMPGALIGYDVDTMTRLYDLEDYVSSFTVARSTSMSVAPAVEGSNVVWSEPTTYAGGDWRLMTLLVARDRVSLPMVWH